MITSQHCCKRLQCLTPYSSHAEARHHRASPADEVSGGPISKGGVAYEADAGVEEGGRGNASASGLLHVAILSWGPQGVLQSGDISIPWPAMQALL